MCQIQWLGPGPTTFSPNANGSPISPQLQPRNFQGRLETTTYQFGLFVRIVCRGPPTAWFETVPAKYTDHSQACQCTGTFPPSATEHSFRLITSTATQVSSFLLACVSFPNFSEIPFLFITGAINVYQLGCCHWTVNPSTLIWNSAAAAFEASSIIHFAAGQRDPKWQVSSGDQKQQILILPGFDCAVFTS